MFFNVFKTIFGAYSRLFPKAACNTARKILMTPRLKNFELPPETATLTLLSHGGALYSWHGTGKTAVLLHGWEGGYKQFSPLIEMLSNNGWTIHIVIAPGHFDLKRGESNPIKFAESLCDASQFIEKIDLLVGHSMGGGVAGLLSSKKLTPSKLVLVAAPASFNEVLRRFADFIGLNKQVHNLFIEHVSAHVKTPISELELLEKAEFIKAHTLIVHDSEDKEIPFSEAESLSERIAFARLLKTTGYGHRRIIQAPDVVEKILSFAEAP